MKLSDQFDITETMFDNHNGHIICITRIDDKAEMIYGQYCTGPYSASELEFAFRPSHDLSYSAK